MAANTGRSWLTSTPTRCGARDYPQRHRQRVNAQSLTLHRGMQRWGDTQFIVRVNNMAPSIDALNRIPIKQAGGATIYLSDVAHVRDGWAVQQNVVRTDGNRSVLLTIIKNGNASTLDVVNQVKAALPEIRRAAPARHENRFAVRSIRVRQQRHPRRAAGRRDRGWLDRSDDVDIPWFLAVDARRHGGNSIVDHDVHRGARGTRADDQHNELLAALRWRSAYWSTTARSRSKIPTAFWKKEQNSTRRFWRVPPVCCPDIDFHARDLQCVCFRVLLAGRCALSLHAAGDGGGVCHARLLWHFAHAHAPS